MIVKVTVVSIHRSDRVSIILDWWFVTAQTHGGTPPFDIQSYPRAIVILNEAAAQ
jgi:hypothetical protein